jgi:hypothetical protein
VQRYSSAHAGALANRAAAPSVPRVSDLMFMA